MKYTLPDNANVELHEIDQIGPLKEMGKVGYSIGSYSLGFVITLKSGEEITVKGSYHYTDWAEVKKRLNKVRMELLAAWERLMPAETNSVSDQQA